jgi:hypothetical protein
MVPGKKREKKRGKERESRREGEGKRQREELRSHTLIKAMPLIT